ncbi:hypothetical protein FKR81_15760 [Lentzea tibetensis]|uniref:Uncharacterized protein n=1 Tax=Lentzea tibetensis TaxID=2591470 RepID=A0A563EU80_9PSEU|nr:hypothetical protein [Lentzea tibetensis]TWP51088.1 hypothetical protein FKR81_15760 [Lentzea tibetensis]
MGSDAELFLFEHGRYLDEVVPALTELTSTGEIRPWLTELIEAVPADPDDDFTWRDEWVGELLPHIREHPGALARHWTECGAQPSCDVDSWILNLFEELVEAAVTSRCLGEHRFVGRTMSTLRYRQALADMRVADDDPIRGLLSSLASRGRAIGHRPVGGTEGIHGWLSPEETADLADRLGRLPVDAAADELARWGLPRVRATAVTAAENGSGLLWGNDVFVEEHQLPEERRALPMGSLDR